MLTPLDNEDFNELDMDIFQQDRDKLVKARKRSIKELTKQRVIDIMKSR